MAAGLDVLYHAATQCGVLRCIGDVRKTAAKNSLEYLVVVCARHGMQIHLTQETHDIRRIGKIPRKLAIEQPRGAGECAKRSLGKVTREKSRRPAKGFDALGVSQRSSGRDVDRKHGIASLQYLLPLGAADSESPRQGFAVRRDRIALHPDRVGPIPARPCVLVVENVAGPITLSVAAETHLVSRQQNDAMIHTIAKCVKIVRELTEAELETSELVEFAGKMSNQ